MNKFRLRTLKLGDAELMLEWMHDEDVTMNLKNNFKEKTIDDCINFIKNSIIDESNCNLAIVDETDTYLGTVSIKNINNKNKSGEFAITIRKTAMGTGCSSYAIKEIINYGFNVLELKMIYWYVNKENKRAIKFYDKNGYKRIEYSLLHKKCLNFEIDNNEKYLWYVIEK